ncbi:MAG: ribosomal protein S18-alanine N-acetyltransferase [Actinobacteria bacterium]|nr:ribosomal protein S18-alanine N-acetyltransferase [Actinomycetota bacterium]
MTGDDAGAVLALEREIFPTPWTEGILRDELAAPRRTYLVAEEDGEIVGYGGVMIVAADAHITNLAVAPSRRGRGVATRLFLDLAEGALDGGAEHLTLEVRLSNLDARRLYSRFGFAPVGIRKDYYVDEDALIMWVTDAAGPEYRGRLAAIREGLR